VACRISDLPHGRDDELHRGSPRPDPREWPKMPAGATSATHIAISTTSGCGHAISGDDRPAHRDNV
jgi:hypothetical protein